MSCHTEKCWHLVSEHKESAGRLCSSLCQVLIYTTIKLVRTRIRSMERDICPIAAVCTVVKILSFK